MHRKKGNRIYAKKGPGCKKEYNLVILDDYDPATGIPLYHTELIGNETDDNEVTVYKTIKPLESLDGIDSMNNEGEKKINFEISVFKVPYNVIKMAANFDNIFFIKQTYEDPGFILTKHFPC